MEFNYAGAILSQSTRKVNKNIKMSISTKKRKIPWGHKSIVTMHNRYKWDKINV